MEPNHHRFSELFAQLGLPAAPEDIAAFIAVHRPLPGQLRLEDAPFWTPAQARLLREELAEDADWAELVDQLNAALRCAEPGRAARRPVVSVRRLTEVNVGPGAARCRQAASRASASCHESPPPCVLAWAPAVAWQATPAVRGDDHATGIRPASGLRDASCPPTPRPRGPRGRAVSATRPSGRAPHHVAPAALAREAADLAHRMQHVYAVILAGGRGSRLHQLTDRRAKPALPFAGKLNIIDFALSNCINSGIRRVGVLTQYKAQSLIRHIERGWGFLQAALGEFIDVVPAQQQLDERWYSGTANAVWQNLEIVREARPDYVLVLAGDHVYKMDYARLLADHIAAGADATVACIEVPLAEARHFGVMAVDAQRRIVAFEEKPAQPQAMPGRPGHALASMGIYVFGTEFLCRQLAEDAARPDSRHDFGHDIIPRLVRSHHLLAHRFADSCVNMVGDRPYWRDVGTVDAFWEANIDLTHVVPELNLYDDDWPILSLQRQVPPAKFVFDDEGRRGTAVDSLVSGGCIVSGATVRRSILFSKARVAEGSLVEDSVILPNVRIGRDVVLKRTIVDKGCVLPDGFCAGVDAEADRARFHVTPRGVTLVTADMLATGRPDGLAAAPAEDSAAMPLPPA